MNVNADFTNGLGLRSGFGSDSTIDRADLEAFALAYNSIAPARMGIAAPPSDFDASQPAAPSLAQTGYGAGLGYGMAFQPGVEPFWSGSAIAFAVRAGEETTLDDPKAADGADATPSSPDDRQTLPDPGRQAGPEVAAEELYAGMPVDAARTIRDFLSGKAS